MVFWIKRGAMVLSCIAFFVVLVAGINSNDPFNTYGLIIASLRGLLAAFVFWLLGFVVGDIILKGVLEDLHVDRIDPLEGGVVQHFHDQKVKQPFFNDYETIATSGKNTDQKT